MKFLMLITTLFVFGCASNEGREMEAKAETAMTEKKMEVEQKVEKEMNKVEEMKESASAKTCNSGIDSRMIEVEKTDKGCEVFYTKNNEKKSIASAKYDLGYCDSIQDRITSNLTNAGFKCE